MDRPWKLSGTQRTVNKVRKVSCRNPERWHASAYTHCTHWENEVFQLFSFLFYICIFWLPCNFQYLKKRRDLSIQSWIFWFSLSSDTGSWPQPRFWKQHALFSPYLGEESQSCLPLHTASVSTCCLHHRGWWWRPLQGLALTGAQTVTWCLSE